MTENYKSLDMLGKKGKNKKIKMNKILKTEA